MGKTYSVYVRDEDMQVWEKLDTGNISETITSLVRAKYAPDERTRVSFIWKTSDQWRRNQERQGTVARETGTLTIECAISDEIAEMIRATGRGDSIVSLDIVDVEPVTLDEALVLGRRVMEEKQRREAERQAEREEREKREKAVEKERQEQREKEEREKQERWKGLSSWIEEYGSDHLKRLLRDKYYVYDRLRIEVVSALIEICHKAGLQVEASVSKHTTYAIFTPDEADIAFLDQVKACVSPLCETCELVNSYEDGDEDGDEWLEVKVSLPWKLDPVYFKRMEDEQ